MAAEGKDKPLELAAEPVKITKTVDECPVDSVTVFVDRAEVTRKISVTFENPGDYELVVEGLPQRLDSDSVRVNGTGHVVLREVSQGVHHKPVVDVEATDETAQTPAVIRQDLEHLQKEIAELNVRKTEVTRSKELLKAYTDNMLKNQQRQKDPEALAAGMEFAFTLLERQQARTREYNLELAGLDDKIAAKNRLVDVAEQKLRAHGASRQRNRTVASHDVTVVLQANQAGEVTLKLMYMVSGASWTPAYDARISSSDTNVALTYYGMVQQNTGENWSNSKIVLSTATPSVGGTAPILPTKHVGFRDPTAYLRATITREHAHAAPRRHMRRGRDRSFAPAMNMQAAMFDVPSAAAAPMAPPAPPAATVATSKVDSSGAATTFHIARRITVESDNKPHKVTVALLTLASAFRHYAVPALNKVAYLQCLTTNTSDYTLLASAAVNVFLDNSFISKTELVTVAPGEKFRTFLGVDMTVKVEYRKLSNVHRGRGYFSKTEDTVHKFVTTVTNNKKMPIRMVVADMLPVSDDQTIKVKLIAPTKEEVEAGTEAESKSKGGAGAAGAGGDSGAGAAPGNAVAQVKATNNLVWTRDIPAGRGVEIPFEYSVEHPGGRPVVTYNKAAGSVQDGVRGAVEEGVRLLAPPESPRTTPSLGTRSSSNDGSNGSGGSGGGSPGGMESPPLSLPSPLPPLMVTHDVGRGYTTSRRPPQPGPGACGCLPLPKLKVFGRR